MVLYNFYSDHVEVVFDGEVILDSRSCGMQRILDEFSYDLSISRISYPKECTSKSFSHLAYLINYLHTIKEPDNSGVFTFLRNHFIASRRRDFFHFRVNIYYF